jgi:exopolyphosphatase/guanosine-5'-triphosphate,3'-diphosphate pyrophosphatase
MMDRRLAGIDIGTLTCRLLIADVPPSGPLKEIRSERRILRLGEGVDQSKRLKPEAMDRVLCCLREWQGIIDDHHVQLRAVVATSAVRDAQNRQELLDRVKSETGMNVEILTGEEEARRTMLGIRSGLPSNISDVLAVDIGGGSTEFILARRAQAPIVRSIDIGVVRLSERVLHGDPPTAAEIQQARDWIQKETLHTLRALPRPERLSFVGTAGTITSLAAMAQRLPVYEPARVHNYRLALATIVNLEQQLLSRSKTARVGMPGLEHNREDVIAAGAIILRTVMETLGERECLVSDLGLREGVLITLADRTVS